MASALPIDSARMAWWLSAWLRGAATPDDVRDAVLDGDAAHDLVGLPGDDGTTPLLLALGAVRRSGARSAGLALPAPGDPTGLGGPADFNAAALDAGEAVVLEGADLGLVPVRAGAGVVWQVLPAARRALVDLGEADRGLRAAVSTAATALVDLEVARWRPEVADELMNLRHVPAYDAPPGTPERARSLAGRALQALGITELAGQDHGAAVTAHEMAQRADALLPLEHAARRALVAACSPEVWPPD
ncbi:MULTISPECIES: hypothetical protein [unclassified Nocardioides]|uniref:hypothetical protein n=1 Tax=unclassified Nocardioides TaxID=2615069 RepID=UPI0006FF74D8|nr:MULTISPECIES: hypothetical protein [unclassified Nocardioides]KQY64391.1 hypothetical protein ASD30_05495 [Nocardioides sp. Root140]KQZ70307.1 hypothetical protein ASD66_11760 [Nocardioides sp. Root151]KRF18162.1 hypothetical protein ASH02_00880 [Nocardioides sp. Soil796]